MRKILRNKLFWLVLFTICVSLLAINATSSDRKNISVIEKVVREMFTPLQGGVSEFRGSWGIFASGFSDKRVLHERIKELEKEKNQLSLENQVLRENEAELKRLKNILDFKNQSLDTYDLKVAKVISRSHTNWYSNVVINKGSKDGIKKGMPVINPEGLVGRVGNVSKNSAQINLITDREVAVGATMQESRETMGIVEGRGDRNLLRMINIPYYYTIEKDSRVVTAGLSQTYPEGIFIGTISSIAREPNGLLLSADLKPAVNFDKLEEVLVITSFKAADEQENGVEE